MTTSMTAKSPSSPRREDATLAWLQRRCRLDDPPTLVELRAHYGADSDDEARWVAERLMKRLKNLSLSEG